MNNTLLSSERQQYIKNQNKYIKQAAVFFVCTLIATIAFFVGILFYFIPDKSHIYNLLLAISVAEILAFYFNYRVLKKKMQNQQELITQMSDTDFQQLLNTQKYLFPLMKYNPPFVFCRDKLYLFPLFNIKEINPTTIKILSWRYYNRQKRGMTFIKTPNTTDVAKMTKELFQHFASIIKHYNPSVQIEML